MALDERSRNGLHNRLVEVLGQDEAATLMEYLPPVGWADVATKRDLDALRDAILAQVRLEIMASQRHLVSVMLASNLTLATLAFAAAKLV